MKKLALMAGLSIFGLSLMGCAPMHHHHVMTAAQPSDPALATRVYNNLAASSLVHAKRIQVQSTNGVITLEGKVPCLKEKRDAGDIAKMTQGVRAVQNHLVVVRKKHHVKQVTVVTH